MLVDHCESCSRDGAGRRGPLLTTPPPPSTAPTSLRPTVSLEQCPTCGSMFSLTELIPHWEVCSKKGAVCDEDGVEQCLHCLKDYLLTDLVEHVKMCPMKDKKVRVGEQYLELCHGFHLFQCLEEEQCAHCLNIFPLNELVEHTLTCAGYHVCLGMGMWNYGCMGVRARAVWAHGNMGTWMYGVWTRGSMSTWTGVWAHGNIGTWRYGVWEHGIMSTWTGVWAHGSIGTWKYGHMGGWAHGDTMEKQGHYIRHTSLQTSGGSQGPLERCMHCFKDFPLSSLIHHTAGCAEGLSGPKDRFKGFVPSVHDVREWDHTRIGNGVMIPGLGM